MNRLVYLSALPWASFAQRPQKFVEWFHASTGGAVLWIDPYPTRFPRWSDIKRIGMPVGQEPAATPPWMQVIKPPAIPLEPLPGSALVNCLLWRDALSQATHFARGGEAVVVVGKPSLLALELLRRLPGAVSVYDAMDDFPQFFDGLARRSAYRRERLLAQQVSHLWASSSCIRARWLELRDDVDLVRNGLDPLLLPKANARAAGVRDKVFGYVGTIASWFDWDWIVQLARARPHDMIRLVGPVFHGPPPALPSNVELLSERPHAAALAAMNEFDVGLIPFQKTVLTASVDPIKYYEYRALGLPVISTSFGEMAFRKNEAGTFISEEGVDIGLLAEQALCFMDEPGRMSHFAHENSWNSRFSRVRIGQL